MTAAPAEAVAMIAAIRRDGEAADLSDHPLRLWATDKANGQALFSLTVAAQGQVVNV
jgi:hypothetical protein